MTRSITLTASIIALGVLLSTTVDSFAFGGPPGGPFGNSSYFPNDGTFSAVVRGENLSGVLQFSTTEGPGPVPESGQEATGNFLPYNSDANAIGGVGSTGIANIYYDGDTYFGNSQGTYNPLASTMSVNFQASVPGQGEQDVVLTQAVIVSVPTVITAPDGTRTVVDDPLRAFDSTQYIYFDSIYLNGFADCKASNSIPNQKFSGTGEAELQFLDFSSGRPTTVAQSLALSVTGVRLSNTATSFATRNVTPPSVNSLSIVRQQ